MTNSTAQERAFPAEAEMIRDAREFAIKSVGDLGGHLEADDCDRLTLVVSELSTNAVLHAHSSFTVKIEVEGRTVRVSVFDSSPERPEPSEPDIAAESGRGLLIVDSLAVAWGVDAESGSPGGGKWVWAELQLHANGSR